MVKASTHLEARQHISRILVFDPTKYFVIAVSDGRRALLRSGKEPWLIVGYDLLESSDSGAVVNTQGARFVRDHWLDNEIIRSV